MELFLYALSDVGLVRTNNEDIAILQEALVRDGSASRTLSLDGYHPLLFGVADGVGGANSGEVASRMVVTGFHRALRRLSEELKSADFAHRLKTVAQQVHKGIVDCGEANHRYHGMASTFTGVVVYKRELFLVQAGDSRLYRLRNDFFI